MQLHDLLYISNGKGNSEVRPTTAHEGPKGLEA